MRETKTYIGAVTKIMFDPLIKVLILPNREYSVFYIPKFRTDFPKYVITTIGKRNESAAVSEECFKHAIEMGWLIDKRTYIIDKILE